MLCATPLSSGTSRPIDWNSLFVFLAGAPSLVPPLIITPYQQVNLDQVVPLYLRISRDMRIPSMV